MEELIKQQKAPPQLDLNLSERGEVKIQGSLTENQLETILDTAYLRLKLFQSHQEKLASEANKSAILIGVYCAFIVGLFSFLSISLKNQPIKSGENHAKSNHAIIL